MIVEQGELAQHWFRLRQRRHPLSPHLSGRAPGHTGLCGAGHLGEAEVLHRGPNTHDAHAHGNTTLLEWPKNVFRQLLREHTEFGEALLTLQARRMRFLYWMMEDMATLPLRARLAKQPRT